MPESTLLDCPHCPGRITINEKSGTGYCRSCMSQFSRDAMSQMLDIKDAELGIDTRPAEPEAPTKDEKMLVQMALHAVEADSATHWPTVAGVLAEEVLRLREVFTDLDARCEKAEEELLAKEREAHRRTYLDDATRLSAKRRGISLVRDYLRGYSVQ